MALRKGSSYRRVKRAYTRKSKFKKKGYIKAVPTVKIIKFDMGDLKKEFGAIVTLFVKKDIQIRHNALESARILINRMLTESLGMNFHLRLIPYPHHVLRENRMITGAGADRLQSGMQLAFGSPVGLAAQLRKGEPVFKVFVDSKDVRHAKNALKKGATRLPSTFGVDIRLR